MLRGRIEFVERLINRAAGDVVVDYRKPSLVENICAAVPKGHKLMFALDALRRRVMAIFL